MPPRVGSLGGKRKRVTGVPLLFFALLHFCKPAVCSVNIVVVRIAFRFGLPSCNNARYPVNENVLHFITEVQARLLLAEGEGFEPPDACTSTVFKTAAFDRSAISPYY